MNENELIQIFLTEEGIYPPKEQNRIKQQTEMSGFVCGG